jgi:hypothetical protein
MQRTEAEEHLRIIRSLMEKATLYRAISAPTALVGGLAALLVGGLLVGPLHSMAEHPLWFFGPWMIVLASAGAANGYFLHREAGRRGDPFFSPGMKMAIKAMIPAHVVAGFFTLLTAVGALGLYPEVPFYLGLPGVWCLAYGLGLLAMEHFAPRSLIWLGWSFVAAGLAAAAGFFIGFAQNLPVSLSPTQLSNTTMALTFGLLHLIYAACTWPRTAAGGNQL